MTTRLSIDEFVDKLRSMKAEDVAKLPLDALPESIPIELIRSSPQPLRGVLEKLAFELNIKELREQQQIEKTFGSAAAQAMDKSRGHETDLVIAKLNQKMGDFSPTLKKWRSGKLSNFAMSKSLQDLRDQVSELHAERARVARAEIILKECLASPTEFEGRLRKGINELHNNANRLDKALAEFHTLQLEIVAAEMSEKRRQIQVSDQKKKSLFEELSFLEEQLKRPSSIFSRLMPWNSRKHEEKLKHQISDVHQRLMSEEWVMAESQLTRWLNALVDASLYSSEGLKAQQNIRTAKLNLFYLLNAYCEQQEASARQVARNPFVQVDPKQAIQYMLMSERFILDYFARKRAEIIDWLGNAADSRLRDLEALETDLIAEMKRNQRRI